jgi:hypothetical protein
VVAIPGVSFQSRAEGVGLADAWLANVATPSKSIPPMWVGVDLLFGPPDGVFGVGHAVNSVCVASVCLCRG